MKLDDAVPIDKLIAPVRAYPSACLIGCGVLLRVVEYLGNRDLWMDETSLAEVIHFTPVSGFFGPLEKAQLAPVGFLVIEHAANVLRDESALALRLLPLLGGLLSLWLFHWLAERTLCPRSALLALGIFVFSEDLIYFATELKPYSTDVTIAILCLLMGANVAQRRTATARLAWLAPAPWFSFPSGFVLAGIGVVLFAAALLEKERRRVFDLIGVGALWIFSSAGALWVARRQLHQSPSMFAFWDFAFPEHSKGESGVQWALRRFAYLFANPLDFSIPGIGVTLPAVLALGLFLVGCVALGRRDSRTLGLLLAPLVFSMIAGYLRLYPFHGRLVLFLTPSLLILIAAGAGWIAERIGGRVAWGVMVGFLVVLPAISAGYYLIEMPRHRDFNPTGDRRPPTTVAKGFPF